MIFVVIFAFLVGTLYAENRTGKIVAIENASTMGMLLKYVYVDSNGDNIFDAIFYIVGNYDKIKGVVLAGYIKNGASIVYNFNTSKIKDGIFFDAEMDSIISIDSIPLTRMFLSH
jgi:hypothetical protein